jgi:hypothetical protein
MSTSAEVRQQRKQSKFEHTAARKGHQYGHGHVMSNAYVPPPVRTPVGFIAERDAVERFGVTVSWLRQALDRKGSIRALIGPDGSYMYSEDDINALRERAGKN